MENNQNRMKVYLLSLGFKFYNKGKKQYYYHVIWKGLEFRTACLDNVWHCSLGNNKNGLLIDTAKDIDEMKMRLKTYTDLRIS
mgnify:FL=1